MSGWIGVDLDGTLAKYDGWKGIEHIGEPIKPMLDRIIRWIHAGKTVKIFTARVSCAEPDRSEVIAHIFRWCENNGLPPLEVTNIKDFGMVELWDDRAVQVVMNTGQRADGQP
jgi:hypothetical protein